MNGLGVRVVRVAERAFDAVFGARANPLRQLGALAFWLLWIVVASGFWVYALYETSVDGAWRSVQELHSLQPWGGGLMRSLHRYASDAFLLVSVVHLLREALLGRFRHFRWFSWVSGMPLPWLALISGVIGYWMVWDQRAQVIGQLAFEWAAVLPGIGLELVRNFIDAQAITDRFFSLLSFLHIGVPLLLLLGLWVHLLRLPNALTQPRRALAAGTLAVLVLASLGWPASLLPRADLEQLPLVIQLDWVYLGLLPLADAAPVATGVLCLAVTLALTLLPWWPPRRAAAPAARVDAPNCNGCTLCLADCPYGAISMAPHPTLPAPTRIAVVRSDLCAGCGVCVGACPSITPSRRGAPVVTGIDLPALPLATLREQLEAAIDALPDAAPRVLVLGCGVAARPGDCGPGTVMVTAPCAAQWPPVFVEYALHRGVDGVLVNGCPDGDCSFRLGERWTAERLAGTRRPQLHFQVPRERVRVHRAAREDSASLVQAVQTFRAALAAAPIPSEIRS